MASALQTVRRLLDGLYALAGAVAALSLLAILGIIVAQMVARWIGAVIPGATNYAGYCMASGSFFALAYALNHGAHIRVSLLLSRLGRFSRYGEIWCYAVAAVTATLFARYALKATYWSEFLGDVSQGQDATPIWLPQIAMSIGTVLLAIALWDHLIRLIFTDHPGVQVPEIGEARD
ncbi:MAG: TRAP transporter small permease [Pseudomonadota bacterium]